MRPCRAIPKLLLLLLLGSSASVGCDGRRGGEGEGEEGEGEDTFPDFTVKEVRDLAGFETVAATGPSSSALKLVITDFGNPNADVRYYDANAYALHDEWYWFRLLNGAAIPGLDDARDQPVTTDHGPFASVDEIYAWALAEQRAGRELPLDLTFIDGDERLYSPRFYDLALFDQPRELGVGTLLHFPAVTTDQGSRPETWALELEFSDEPTAADLRVYFSQLEATLFDDVTRDLKWITRSLAQEAIAATLPDDLKDRVISFADVVVPGQKEVYSEGLTAGRLLFVPRGEEELLLTSRATDVLVVEDVPDFLPACAALLTAQPQTALAHVNLLARNRGIPNAFIAGVDVDPNLDQLARVRAPVIVRARGANDVVVQAMTEQDFATFRSLSAVPPTAVPPVNLDDVVATYALSDLDFADADEWRPVLGGKSTGFLALLDAGVVTVEDPVAISIKPYDEHLDTTGLRAKLAAMLEDRSFAGEGVIRRLVLEGAVGVDDVVVAQFKASRPVGNVLRDLVDAGGVTNIIRDTPMNAATLAEIEDALDVHFGRYAVDQGLRFRSSSNVEDAEGFNGAGLYTSNTGFLRPGAGDVGVEEAVKETWASYWGVEAFEERRLALVDHLSGAMGVTVHANFPDRQELNNGVALFTLMPDGSGVFEVNQQEGALSVTNPPVGSDHLPEISRVVDYGGELVIERVRSSTVLLPGDTVLDDDTLRAMYADARAITELWLAVENGNFPAAQRRSTFTLDFETRFVDEGWPALRSGLQRPARLVWKQARPLEPSTARAPAEVQQLPIPRDILARARRVVRHTCEGADVRVFATEVITDSALQPDMGHSEDPFTAFVVVDFVAAAEEVGAAAGTRRSSIHTAFQSVAHPVLDWSLDVSILPDRAPAIGLERVRISADGEVIIDNGGSITRTTTCTQEIPFAAPADFLEGLLENGPTPAAPDDDPRD